MKNTRINWCVDCDGVLSDFTSYALDALNDKLRTKITLEQYAKTKEFSMYKVFNISPSLFWKTIEDADIWSNMDPFLWALDLIDYLDHYGDITICTSPSRNPQCAAKKIIWIQKHLGLGINSIMIGSRKYLMAKDGNVLIDDWDKNTKEFTEHGGKAILVPSNWNTPDLSFNIVKESIESQL